MIRSLSAKGSRHPSLDEVVKGLEAISGDFLPTFTDSDEAELAQAIAYAPEVDKPLAEQLTGNPNAWAIVKRFDHQRLGRMALRRGRHVFLMHTLVSSALRNSGSETLAPERILNIRALIYAHLSELGVPIDLLKVLIDTGGDEVIWAHFVRHFSELSLHRTQELSDALADLPERRLKRNSELAIILGNALSEASVIPTKKARALARPGLENLKTPDPKEGRLATVLHSIAKLAAQRVYRNYDAASDAGVAVVSHIQGVIEAGSGVNWNAGILQAVLSHVLAHRFDRFFEVASILDDDRHPGRRTHLFSLRAFSHAYSGDLLSAKRFLEIAGNDDQGGWGGSMHTVGWQLASALTKANDGEAEVALQGFPSFREHLHRLDLWAAILWTRGFIQLVSGNVQEGLSELEREVERCSGYPISERWAEHLRVLRAEFQIANGDYLSAQAVLEQAGTAPATRLASARLQLLLKQPGTAMAQLDASASTEYLTRQDAERTLLRAIAHDANGSSDATSALAKQGIAMQQRLGNCLVLSLLPTEGYARIVALVGSAVETPLAKPFVGGNTVTQQLTRRETIVLGELATGAPIETLAQKLHVSPNTVKSQTRSLYRKLGVNNRAEAIRKAVQLGLL